MSNNNNNNANSSGGKVQGRDRLYLSDALRTLDIYRWEGDESDNIRKKSNYLILRQSAETPTTKGRVDDWDDVFNDKFIAEGKTEGEEVPEDQLNDEPPKELIAAFEHREPLPQLGLEETQEIQVIDTNELQDEICDIFAVMFAEMQLREEQEEQTDQSTTSTNTITTTTTTATDTPSTSSTTSNQKVPFRDNSHWEDVDATVGKFDHGKVVVYGAINSNKPKKSLFAKLKDFASLWKGGRKQKAKKVQDQTEDDRLQQSIDRVKQISRETELLRSYDYGPQQFFFGKNTLEMSILECFKEFVGCELVIEKILNEMLVERFIRKWWQFKKMYGEDSSQAKVRLVFHGTSRYNLESIMNTGLRIPYEIKGVIQANGAAHGRGVYVSRHVSVATGYSSDLTILVCAAVLGKIARGSSANLEGYNCNVVDWSSSGDCIVLYESDQVLPLYVAKGSY
eukprot:TRINITY_DN2525_c0_g2_i6.p1 TRINITY_DN2525_c0_g2~~TRINITY_DN2525_c0_g2_i6.p1  ORF type:complete len:525 (+),score=158.85 TRINITY_DN2525_c0_g2_i6:217-1575(+)